MNINEMEFVFLQIIYVWIIPVINSNDILYNFKFLVKYFPSFREK